jgi:hypothetical protein
MLYSVLYSAPYQALNSFKAAMGSGLAKQHFRRLPLFDERRQRDENRA